MSEADVLTMTPIDRSPSDESLMASVAMGNPHDFDELVRRHQQKVFRMAVKMLGNEDDAWDSAQEVFIKVYQARDSYVSNAKFTTWLYRIANNAIIDRIRKNKRKSMHVISSEDSYNDATDPSHSPQDKVELYEQTDLVSKALAKLSERQRGMVLLKYYQGFSVKEIAEIFDCATGTVKATLFQSVRNLRQHLADLGHPNMELTS
jgi:RNA polymerase sigma-70 factor (ECF subfamily)